MYRLKIKRTAQRELDTLPDQIFTKVDKAILTLQEQPFPFPQSKKLKGEDKCRLRIGDYRVVYAVNKGQRLITIFRVRHRRGIYR